ncbi:hypothetical protein M3649_07380 [Ureibacillus chungkukjangi]|uniref:hypothetical protein n=1 Tax=Ureibacillus chungkukjangi TaxID=1202712 RepID=UPI00203C8064|nr:hypothetical protein [Ureibacillus chungkukjangi]MCM3387956.1 hypothetical protein [Ureibacillus chungkukjangi]
MGNSGRVWVIIGAIMILIGIVFAGLTSYFLENKIDQLVATCEKEGGKAIVDRGGFIVTTSFEYECKK